MVNFQLGISGRIRVVCSPLGDAFIHELWKMFGASIFDDPLGRISKLVQSGTVSQYRAEFEGLMM